MSSDEEDKDIEELQRRFEQSVVLVHPDQYPEYYDIYRTNLLDEQKHAVEISELSENLKHYLYLIHERDLFLKRSRRMLREMKQVKQKLLKEWKDNYTFKVKSRFESRLYDQNFTLHIKQKCRNLTLSEFQRMSAKQLARTLLYKNFQVPQEINALTNWILECFYTVPLRLRKRDQDIVRRKYQSQGKYSNIYKRKRAPNHESKQPTNVNPPKRRKPIPIQLGPKPKPEPKTMDEDVVYVHELSLSESNSETDDNEIRACPSFLDESKF